MLLKLRTSMWSGVVAGRQPLLVAAAIAGLAVASLSAVTVATATDEQPLSSVTVSVLAHDIPLGGDDHTGDTGWD